MSHRPVILSFFLFALALAGVGEAIPAAAQPRDIRLQDVRSFAFAIGTGALEGDYLNRLMKFDLVVVDGEEAGASQVAALQGQGVLVLAYLSVGAIENYRWWYRSVKKYRLKRWGEWGEWYADTSKSGYRKLIRERVAPWILEKGFDGFFLDNFDMIQDHRRQAKGMYKLVQEPAAKVHSQGKPLFTQNGEAVISPILSVIDGWNREDVTSTYNFDTEEYELVSSGEQASALQALRIIAAQGILTTTTDYTAANDTDAAAAAAEVSCNAGALPYISDIELTRIPAAAIVCEERF